MKFDTNENGQLILRMCFSVGVERSADWAGVCACVTVINKHVFIS